MAITFDSASSSSCDYRSGGSWSHTVGVGANRYLFVLFMGYCSGSLPLTITSASYNGKSGTKLYSYGQAGSGTFEIWCIPDPPIGTANIVYTTSGSPSLSMSGVSYFGVEQSDNPFYTAQQDIGSGTSASVTSLEGGADFVLAFASWGSDAASITPDAGQNERVENINRPPNRGVWASDESNDDKAGITLSSSAYYILWAAVLKGATSGQSACFSGGAMAIF